MGEGDCSRKCYYRLINTQVFRLAAVLVFRSPIAGFICHSFTGKGTSKLPNSPTLVCACGRVVVAEDRILFLAWHVDDVEGKTVCMLLA